MPFKTIPVQHSDWEDIKTESVKAILKNTCPRLHNMLTTKPGLEFCILDCPFTFSVHYTTEALLPNTLGRQHYWWVRHRNLGDLNIIWLAACVPYHRNPPIHMPGFYIPHIGLQEQKPKMEFYSQSKKTIYSQIWGSSFTKAKPQIAAKFPWFSYCWIKYSAKQSSNVDGFLNFILGLL